MARALQVDLGCEFMGVFSEIMKENGIKIRRGRVDIHRDRVIVERFNGILAERPFGHQYVVEMKLAEGQRATEWVVRLPPVVSALKHEMTRLVGEKPAKAIKEKAIVSKPSTPYFRPVGLNEEQHPVDADVRYLYQLSELEGGRRRAADLSGLWKYFNIKKLRSNQTNLFCIF